MVTVWVVTAPGQLAWNDTTVSPRIAVRVSVSDPNEPPPKYWASWWSAYVTEISPPSPPQKNPARATAAKLSPARTTFALTVSISATWGEGGGPPPLSQVEGMSNDTKRQDGVVEV